MRRSLFLLFFLIVVPTVKADPITFDFGSVVALQEMGSTSVNLNTPDLLLAPTSIDTPSGVRSLNVSFNITVDAGQTWAGIVRYDWVLNGVASTTFNENCVLGCTSDVIHGVGSFLDYTTPFYIPVPASLTISVINDTGEVLGSASYSFRIAEPVPEPTTVVLLGSGLVALWRFRARSLQRRR